MQVNFSTARYSANILPYNSIKKENISFSAAKSSGTHSDVAKSVYPELLLLAQDVYSNDEESIQDASDLLYGVIDDALMTNSLKGTAFQSKLVTEELLDLAFDDYIKLHPNCRYYNQMRSILANTKNIAQEKLEK